MPRVCKEQIDAANRMTAIEFLRRYRPGSLVKSSARGEYQLAEHDSFKINGESSVWHWKSRDIGGKSALKYLIYVEGVPFVEAVQLLCEESPTYIPVQHEAVERERPQFKLPRKAPTNDRVTRYLLGRGISLPTIRYCIARKILYESAEYHNCVFLGKDPQGVPKYAALRGIYDYGKPFKREAPGSQKQYGFCIPPMQPGTTVAVFEAAIDAMAEMTLCGDAADKYRLSLGGVSSSGKEPLALQEFLTQLSFLALCAFVNRLGLEASSGYGVACKIVNFAMLIPSSLMQSMASFVSQNVGAGKKKRAKQSMFTGIGVGLVVGCLVFVLVMFKGDVVAGIFSTDASVIQNAFDYLKGFAPETIVTAILFSMIGYFNGNNKTVWVMIQGLVQTLLVRLPLAYYMSIQPNASLTKIGLAAPVATVTGIILKFIS